MPLVPRHIQDLESYKPGRNIDDVREELGLDNIIKLASNENPLGPSLKAIKAIKNSIENISSLFLGKTTASDSIGSKTSSPPA